MGSRWIIAIPMLILISAAIAMQNDGSRPRFRYGNFHTWKKVNPIPMTISPVASALCRAPSPGAASSPHMTRTITVWVNPLGERAMLHGGAFPAGSVIVKEKRFGPTGRVDMSTVMIKHRGGYNLKCGDWEFQTLDPSGKDVTSDGKLGSCMTCHRSQAKFDYTYRSYTPRPGRQGFPKL